MPGTNQELTKMPWWGWALVAIAGPLALFGLFDDRTDEVFEAPTEISSASAPSIEDSPTDAQGQNALEESKEESSEFEWPSFESVTIAGSGDDVLVLDNPLDTFSALDVTANADGRYFSIKTLGMGGDVEDLVVTSTDPFKGTVLLEGGMNSPIAGFEIKAKGEWALTLKSIQEVPKMEATAPFVASGYQLVRIDETAGLTTVHVVGNADGRYFSVKTHGSTRDLAIMTTDPYEGVVRVNPGTSLFEVNAIGDWVMELQ